MQHTKQSLLLKTKSKITKIIFVVVVVLLIVIASLLLIAFRDKRAVTDNATPLAKPINGTVNYGPPTEEEKKAGDIQKQTLSENEQPTKPNTAEVVIADANQYGDEIEVRAFVANLLQKGTCTFTFSKAGEQSFTRQTNAQPDASTSPCITLILKRSVFPSGGAWQLKVTYETSKITGSKTQEMLLL